MTKKDVQKQIALYQSANGEIRLKMDGKGHTLWASLSQIAELFGVEKPGISKHINKIYASKELPRKGTVSKMETVQTEGGRKVSRQIDYYNLDLILSVGYRVNSLKATRFRQWATKILRQHIEKGYTLNRQQIKSNYEEFLDAVDKVKSLLPSGESVTHDTVLELIKLFADTWFSLDAYDRDQLEPKGATKKKALLTGEKLSSALDALKDDLIAKNEASELFGAEKHKDSISGIVGNVMQSFDGHDVYPTIEEKAANLLYFIVKNHPFVDGNKRSGAYAFIWFLNRSKILDTSKITPPALTALTLLIAESDPKHKEKMVGLVCVLLK